MRGRIKKGRVSKKYFSFFENGIDKAERLWSTIQVVSESTMGDGSAGVAELADARDLKSRDTRVSYRFETGHRHHTKFHIIAG